MVSKSRMSMALALCLCLPLAFATKAAALAPRHTGAVQLILEPEGNVPYYEYITYNPDGSVDTTAYYLHMPRIKYISSVAASLTMRGDAATCGGTGTVMYNEFGMSLILQQKNGSEWKDYEKVNELCDPGSNLMGKTWYVPGGTYRSKTSVTAMDSEGRLLETVNAYSESKTYTPIFG